MPFFDLTDGRLTQSKGKRTVDPALTKQVLDAVSHQVLELIDQPLLPVAWLRSDDERSSHRISTCTRLLALDSMGRVVTVEVHNHFDAAVLVEALSRAGKNQDLSRAEISHLYPGGAQGFAHDWPRFVDSCPPHLSSQVRLVIVAANIDPSVRPALGTLAGAGLAVYEVNIEGYKDQARVEFSEIKFGWSPVFDRVLPNPPSFTNLPEVELHEPEAEVNYMVNDYVEVDMKYGEPNLDYFQDENTNTYQNLRYSRDKTDEPEIKNQERLQADSLEQVSSPFSKSNSVDAHETSQTLANNKLADSLITEIESAVTEQIPLENIETVQNTESVEDIENSVAEAVALVNTGNANKAPNKTPANKASVKTADKTQDQGFANADSYLYSFEDFLRVDSSPADVQSKNAQKTQEIQYVPVETAKEEVPETTENTSAISHHKNTDSFLPSLTQVASIVDTPATVWWVSRRRGISFQGLITPWGTLQLEDGTAWSDPSSASMHISGREVDGWKVWKIADGRTLGELF